MAWIGLFLDDTLVQDMGDGQEVPVIGAPEAVAQLAQEGHRLTVVTSRFAPMPQSERHRMKTQIEETLVGLGFPPLEVWTGTTLPACDAFIGDKLVTFDQDWGLALSQMQMMLEELGLAPGPMPDDGSIEPEPEEPPTSGGEGGANA